jgi:hypothetical protein
MISLSMAVGDEEYTVQSGDCIGSIAEERGYHSGIDVSVRSCGVLARASVRVQNNVI